MAAPFSDPPQLYPSTDNPLPDNARAASIVARDGTHLRYALFAATARPFRGTFIILPGRNEPIEKYFETVVDLQTLGYGVAVLDLRGQGGSDRPLRDPHKGHVTSFANYVSDLELFLEQVVLPDCRPPYYLLGHSTGGLIALMAAPALTTQIDRMVLSAPLIEFDGRRMSMARLESIAGVLFAVGFGGMYFGSRRRPAGGAPFEGNAVTSDARRYARNQRIYDETPQIALGGPTVGWFRAACAASHICRDPAFMATVTVPTLMVAAGADTVVSTPAIERYALGLRSSSVLTIDGARHELLQERDVFREQFLAALKAFVGLT